MDIRSITRVAYEAAKTADMTRSMKPWSLLEDGDQDRAIETAKSMLANEPVEKTALSTVSSAAFEGVVQALKPFLSPTAEEIGAKIGKTAEEIQPIIDNIDRQQKELEASKVEIPTEPEAQVDPENLSPEEGDIAVEEAKEILNPKKGKK